MGPERAAAVPAASAAVDVSVYVCFLGTGLSAGLYSLVFVLFCFVSFFLSFRFRFHRAGSAFGGCKIAC